MGSGAVSTGSTRTVVVGVGVRRKSVRVTGVYLAINVSVWHQALSGCSAFCGKHAARDRKPPRSLGLGDSGIISEICEPRAIWKSHYILAGIARSGADRHGHGSRQ